MLYKYFDTSACKIVESDDEERTLIFTISDETVDRYKEIMKAKGCQLEEYLKNPVVLWAHNRNQELPPIGRAEWVKKVKNSLKAKVQFAPTEFATSIYELYKKGFMNGVSVGYITLEWKDVVEDNDTPARKIIEKWELLEFSAVPVPANPNALISARDAGIEVPELAMKSFEDWCKKETKFCQAHSCSKFPCENSKERDVVFEKLYKEETPIEETPEIALSEEEVKLLLEEKPFENEHSCRLEDPKQFDKFNRKNCQQKHDGKCIDVIFGIKANKSKIQALRYNKKVWTEGSAKAHCKTREGRFEPAKKDKKDIDYNAFIGIVHGDDYTSDYICIHKDLVELFGEEKADAIWTGELDLIEILKSILKKDHNEIDLENIEVNDGEEINLAEIEVLETGLESSDKDVLDLTEKDVEDLIKDLKKEFGEEISEKVVNGFIGELRTKYLGKVD